ncbi:PREDICTED: uncharacterized protein LOC108774424 isoform X2 [Cyphomyrmex costatus]|uniref:uncharacterized protein LOC108774424 isoform X2 n=1 Tax=Cyphomyrmex costatus TaxID=456900 RepID=UPI0008523D28|nr:PREDICTED: uncharacterized protein LOC108774424 isoform X2 [Cyphomyrmex costatus]
MHRLLSEYNLIHSPPMAFILSEPRSRRSLRPEDINKSYLLNNNFQSLEMENKTPRQQNTSNSFETGELLTNQYFESEQMTESCSEEDEKTQSLHHSQNCFPIRYIPSQKRKSEGNIEKNEQNISSCAWRIFAGVFIILIIAIVVPNFISNNKKTQAVIFNNPALLTESVKDLKATFYNQESDIWIDISSAINEVISRIPKIPSIILLFAEEPTTMNCLATKLAHISSTILNADDYLKFNPKDFGNDAGEVITILKELSVEKKKVVIIHDILNINAEAVKALHNLCDRINPLVAEAIYILTMQTNSSLSQQNKLKFVEEQIYNRLSRSIDQDILMALVTRVTDGIIISVQPEPQLRYC